MESGHEKIPGWSALNRDCRQLSATQADTALGVSPRGISSGFETGPVALCTRRGANSLAFVSYCAEPF